LTTEKEERTKKCPFSQAWCEKDACALYVEFGQRVAGMERRVGMCVFVGSNVILSEMNQKLTAMGQPPMPMNRFQIPGIGRG